MNTKEKRGTRNVERETLVSAAEQIRANERLDAVRHRRARERQAWKRLAGGRNSQDGHG